MSPRPGVTIFVELIHSALKVIETGPGVSALFRMSPTVLVVYMAGVSASPPIEASRYGTLSAMITPLAPAARAFAVRTPEAQGNGSFPTFQSMRTILPAMFARSAPVHGEAAETVRRRIVEIRGQRQRCRSRRREPVEVDGARSAVQARNRYRSVDAKRVGHVDRIGRGRDGDRPRRGRGAARDVVDVGVVPRGRHDDDAVQRRVLARGRRRIVGGSERRAERHVDDVDMIGWIAVAVRIHSEVDRLGGDGGAARTAEHAIGHRSPPWGHTWPDMHRRSGDRGVVGPGVRRSVGVHAVPGGRADDVAAMAVAVHRVSVRMRHLSAGIVLLALYASPDEIVSPRRLSRSGRSPRSRRAPADSGSRRCWRHSSPPRSAHRAGAAETCVDVVDAGVDNRDRHPFAGFTERLPRLVCADESDARSVAGLSQWNGMNRFDARKRGVPCGILWAVRADGHAVVGSLHRIENVVADGGDTACCAFSFCCFCVLLACAAAAFEAPRLFSLANTTAAGVPSSWSMSGPTNVGTWSSVPPAGVMPGPT